MLRKKDFKLGCFHGKAVAENNQSEAQIQRTLFLNKGLRIVRSKTNVSEIHLFGYETPLEQGNTRGKCIDLLGYDKDHNLYLIELKKGQSSEKMPKIIEQINAYAVSAKEILSCIEDEFKKAFYLPIKFRSIKKVVLAPKEFYTTERKKGLTDMSVEYGFFRERNIEEHKLAGKAINVHLIK
jgi:hypothetical protein